VICSSKTSADVYQTTWHYIPEDEVFNKQTLQTDLKLSTRWKKKFWKTPGMMEGFCFAIPITDFNRNNNGKDDDEKMSHFISFSECYYTVLY
jgi:hypothetical protein